MPTGYTAGVADGTITALDTFVYQLSRGMGALVTMRDEPASTPVPERFEVDGYYVDALAKARTELARLSRLSLADAKTEADAEYEVFKQRRDEKRKNNIAIRDRYNDMLLKVRAWQGAPEGIKEFAIQQLESGRDFDAPVPFKFYGEEPPTDPEVWLEGKLKEANRQVSHYAEELGKETARVEGRNAWLARLRTSLNGT